MSESVKKNIYLKISPVHGIFVANKSLDHKVTLQTQAEAVSFLLRDLNWKIPYVPQWVHTLTDTNLPSSTLRSQIWSISPAPDWTPPKMSEGKLIKALKQEFLLAMKVTFLLGLDAPSFYPWEWQCYFTMTGHVMGAVLDCELVTVTPFSHRCTPGVYWHSATAVYIELRCVVISDGDIPMCGLWCNGATTLGLQLHSMHGLFLIHFVMRAFSL